MSEELHIIVPKGMIPDEDLRTQLVEVGIRVIARACEGYDDDVDTLKYGVNYKNEVFRMHRYCWCEKEDCEYCREENPAPNFIHFQSGLTVHWYKYIGRSMEISDDLTDLGILRMLEECLLSIPQ